MRGPEATHSMARAFSTVAKGDKIAFQSKDALNAYGHPVFFDYLFYKVIVVFPRPQTLSLPAAAVDKLASLPAG